MIYVLIAITILTIIFGLVATRDNIFSPAVITSAVWLFCLLLYAFLPHGLPALNGKFFTALLFWVTLLPLSALWVQPIIAKRQTSDIQASKLIRDIYLIISIIAFISFLLWVKNNLNSGFSGNWAENLRKAALGKGTDNGESYEGIHIIITFISLILELIYFEKKNWHRLLTIVICCLGYGFFLMAKTIFLNIFIICVCVLFFRKIVKIQHVAIGIVALFFAFLAFQNLRQHRENKSEDFATLYLVSGMYAFETLQPASSENFGENSFRIYYAIANKLDISDTKPVEPILKFIYKPIQTNTYTALYPFYKDFGLWSIGVFAVFFGLFFGWLFAKANAGNMFFVGLYAYLANVLVVQYANETLFTNISGIIKFVFFLAIPFFAEKYKMFYKKTEQ